MDVVTYSGGDVRCRKNVTPDHRLVVESLIDKIFDDEDTNLKLNPYYCWARVYPQESQTNTNDSNKKETKAKVKQNEAPLDPNINTGNNMCQFDNGSDNDLSIINW